jgi:hypothetical protein
VLVSLEEVNLDSSEYWQMPGQELKVELPHEIIVRHDIRWILNVYVFEVT